MALKASVPGERWSAVVVQSTDDGLVTIAPVGAEPIPAHLGAAVDVAGGTLVVDARPGGPDGPATAGNVPPTASVFDPYWALTWLREVYGDGVVDAVKTAAREPGTPAVTVDATFGQLSDVMVRLGLATWLHRWWPEGNRDLDVTFLPSVLEIEVGALRWLAEAAFIEQGPIERVLRPHTERLHGAYDDNRANARPGQRQELVEDVLVTALRAVVDVVPESTDCYQKCQELLHKIDAGTHQGPHEDYHQFVEETERYANAGVLTRGKGPGSAGDGPDAGWTTLDEGSTTYDVRDVPPRTFADTEDNVHWQIQETGGGMRLVVTAEASPMLAMQPETPIPLMARAFVGDAPHLFDLTWIPRGGRPYFEGATALPAGTAPESVRVGVFHPSWAGEARVSDLALERALAERHEINRILIDRHARLGERVGQAFVVADPSQRPTAAEVLAQRRG